MCTPITKNPPPKTTLTINIDNTDSKENSIRPATIENKIPEASAFNLSNTSDQDIKSTKITQRSIQYSDTHITKAKLILLRCFDTFGIQIQNITINKMGNISGYQIRLTAVNGFSVNLRVKQIASFDNIQELNLILKLGILTNLIDNHTSPKLAENMLVMADATHDKYKYVISLAVDNISLSFNRIDDLINKKFFKQFILSGNDTTRSSIFNQIKEYFEIKIKKNFMDNGIDYSTYDLFLI